MIQKTMKYLVLLAIATAAGFGCVFLGMGEYFSSKTTETHLGLKIHLRGNNNLPVANARLSILFPQEKVLGTTDVYGNFEATVKLPSGKVSTLQATGPSFRILKDIFVPRLSKTKMEVFLDPTEAKLGHMNLMSRNLQKFNEKIESKLARNAAAAAAASVNTKRTPQNQALPPSPALAAHQTLSWPRANDAPADRSASVVVEILPAPHSSAESLLQDQKTALVAAVVRGNGDLKQMGVTMVKLRLASEEGPYFEVLATDNSNAVLATTLVKSVPGRKSVFDLAVRRLTKPSPVPKLEQSGRLLVKTGSPHKTRAYLNGVALPRKLKQGSVLFDFSAWQNLPENKKAFLAVTSEDGPFIRTQLSSAQLKRKMRWTLPETQISKR